MTRPTSPLSDLHQVSHHNPFVDLRQIEEWRATIESLRCLGVDLRHPSTAAGQKSAQLPHIPIRFLRFPSAQGEENPEA